MQLELRRHRDLDAVSYDSMLELDDGTVIPPIPVPGTVMASILLLDTGTHLHDLAVALDRADLAGDQGLAAATLDAARTVLQPGIRELAGFAPERPVPPNATAVEALLAFTGR